MLYCLCFCLNVYFFEDDDISTTPNNDAKAEKRKLEAQYDAAKQADEVHKKTKRS